MRRVSLSICRPRGRLLALLGLICVMAAAFGAGSAVADTLDKAEWVRVIPYPPYSNEVCIYGRISLEHPYGGATQGGWSGYTEAAKNSGPPNYWPCADSYTAVAGGLSMQRRWLKWNGSAYVSCQSWQVNYSGSASYVWSWGPQASGTNPPCSTTTWYVLEATHWVWQDWSGAWRTGGNHYTPGHWLPS